MATLTKLYPLNAKAIKAALRRENVKVYSCKRGTGSAKNATYIYVDYSNAVEAVSFLRNIGVVDCLNKPLTILGRITKIEGVFNIGACYMDIDTYKEINS